VRVPIPYVAARSTELPPLVSDLCVEVPPNGKPRLAYTRPHPGDRDAHGNLWARMTAGEGGTVLYHSMHPTRQRRCMENLWCQVCAQPAPTAAGTLFIEWQHPDEPPLRLERVVTDMPPLCPACVPLSLKYCPFLREEEAEPVLLLARKSVVSGVSGTLYRVQGDREGWTASEEDVYSSYTQPRLPGLLAQRLYRKLRGVSVLDPDSLTDRQGRPS